MCSRQSSGEGKALVLGAGGHAASSWEIGLIAGMADAGIDVRDAGLLVGTSAGARVAVQLASGLALEVLFAQQSEPVPAETADIDWERWRRDIADAKACGGGSAAVLKRIGSLATVDVDERDRRWFGAADLPVDAWPERRICIAAVEVESGERRTFDRTTGIALSDAVAASGALPAVWPAVEFQGHHYIDGGFYSTENADLAAGFDPVLVLALRAGNPPFAVTPLEPAVQALERGHSHVQVIYPDPATQAIFDSVHGNVLDPSIRLPALRTARTQGQRLARDGAMAFWHTKSVTARTAG